MTEEEMQQKIIEHEQTITTLTEQNNTYKTTIEQNKTDTELLNTRIQELKDHNRSLFLKITTPEPTTEPKKPTEPEKITVDNVVSKILTKD